MNGRFTLNQAIAQQWVKNLLSFLAPVGILYLTPVIGVMSLTGHVVSLKDFIPSSFTLGGMVLYVLNGIYDLIKKFIAAK